MQKTIVVVLGMSRTGTSAIARSLLALGVDLGDQVLPGNELNPKGFWEDKDILQRINRGASRAINQGYLWLDEMQAADIEHHPLLQIYQHNAIALLQNRLAKTQKNYWGFKDPRTVTLVPFWQSVFSKLHVNDCYVITLRNPLAAALSNQKFIRCDLEEAILIWVDQMIAAIDGTHHKKRILVSYENMLDDPRRELQRIHVGLALQTEWNEMAISDYADSFLDKKLKHHHYNDEDFYQHDITKVAPLSSKIYRLLAAVANDELSFTDAAFGQQWQAIKLEHKAVFALHRYVDNLVKRNKMLQKELKRMNKSILGKALYPVRRLESFLRKRRLSHCRKKNSLPSS